MARLPCSTHHAHTVTRSPTAAATATAAHKNPPSTPSTTTTKPHPTPQQQQQLRRILKTIDPYGAHAHALAIQQRLRSRRREALAPDFDVRETASAFYLEGELPGIGDRDAVRLDWIDRRTLSVEATIEKVDLEVEWGLLRPIRVGSVGLSSSSSSTSSAASTSSASDHGEDMTVDEEHDEDAGGKGIEAQPSKPEVREWLSERRTGHYQRTFTFPTDVDASAIRARLGQGLLRVLVPKVVRKGGNQTQVNIEDCE